MAENGKYGWGIRTIGVIGWSLSALSAFGAALAIAATWGMPPTQAPVTVSGFLPADMPAAVLGGTGFTSGLLRVDSLPVVTKIWMTASIVSTAGLFIGIALTVSTLVASVRDGAGFTKRLPRTLYVLAGGVLVLGVLLSISDQLAALTLGQALFPADSDDRSVPTASSFFLPSSWPLYAAAAIAALGFVFDRAARLQRDAAGLV